MDVDAEFVHRPLFGDVFGDRGDYTKGTFYASRRTFLGVSPSKNPAPAPSSSSSPPAIAEDELKMDGLDVKLKAPDFLLTRKQVYVGYVIPSVLSIFSITNISTSYSE